MKFKILFFIFFTFLNEEYLKADNSNSHSCIYGRIENSVNDKIYLILISNSTEALSGYTYSDSVITSQNGYFEFCMNIDNLSIFSLKKNHEWLIFNMIILQENKLELNFAKTSMELKGSDNAYNRFILDFRNEFYNEEYRNRYSNNIDSFEIYMDQLIDNQIIFFKKKFGSDTIPDAFIQFMLNTIKLEWANSRLQYPLIYSLNKKTKTEYRYTNISEQYFEFLKYIDFNQRNLFYLPQYITFVRQILNEFIFNRQYLENKDIKVNEQGIFKAINGLPYFEEHEARHIAYAIIFKDEISRSLRTGKTKFLDSLQVLYSKESTHIKLTPYINSLLESFYNMYSENFDPSFSIQSIDGNQLSLSDLKGNVVLLNFWSLDCGASLKEIPYLNALALELKNSKFVIVNISLDNSTSRVKSFLKEIDDFIGFHLIALNGANSEIAEKYNIRSTPHYVLINREGKIKAFSAPNPSHASLISTIQKMFE